MDAYRVLQVSRDAEPEVIERAYKALCLKYHPDRVPPSERASATRHMQQLNAAYAILGDAENRARYDAGLPPEDGEAWETFWKRGLWGMFQDRFGWPTWP